VEILRSEMNKDGQIFNVEKSVLTPVRCYTYCGFDMNLDSREISVSIAKTNRLRSILHHFSYVKWYIEFCGDLTDFSELKNYAGVISHLTQLVPELRAWTTSWCNLAN